MMGFFWSRDEKKQNPLSKLQNHQMKNKNKKSLKDELEKKQLSGHNKIIDEVSKIFEDYLLSKLDQEFIFISTSKNLSESIPPIKNLLLKEATRMFLKSNEGEKYFESYIESKENSIANGIYKNHYDVFTDFWKISSETYFNEWTNTYLKTIHIILTLFLDKNVRAKELKELGITNKNKKRGARTKYAQIFSLVPHFKKRLAEQGKKSNDTATIKYICKVGNIPYNRNIVTAYNNHKRKLTKNN